MSEFWSSALNYFGGGSDSSGGSRFVGQTVDLGEGNKLRVKKVIAEGGYGYVFIAQDTKTGKDYALKRQVVATENVKLIKQEIAFLKQLSDHPHIVQFVAAAGCPPTMTSHGSAEFLIQTELCSGGRMEDIVVSMRLTPRQVLRVFYETCSAVAHMHSQDPPIIHRDLKVENLLLSARGAIKLCDFGSATTERLHPDRSWTAVQRGLAEDEIQRNTTPMYRAPEMIDLYSNSPINESADVWALGCLLYKLCYQEHPFEDSAKLRILNANYRMPANDNSYAAFQGIIRSCLVVDPAQRPSVDSVIAQLYILADQLGESLDQPPTEPLIAPAAVPASEPSEGSSGVQAALQSTHRFFGFMKEGAESLFKNIKEGSNKIVESMSGHGGLTSKHPHLDITYITSRIIAMSFPHEDSSHPNSIDEVRTFLDSRHAAQYLVFNLSGHSYDTARLNNQVADVEWPERWVPDLEKMVDVCRNLDSWLRADQQNIVVIHCHDGQSFTPVLVAAYLLFLGAFRSPAVPLKLFSSKRVPDAPPIIGSGSEQRYLQHIVDLVGPRAYKPHTQRASLKMLRMTTIPLFNAIRTGCKPFVEVYQNGERVYTSASQDSMDQIRSFSTSEDTSVEVPLEATVRGNVMVIVHHIRAIPIARKAGVGMTAVRMFQFQLHTGFISPDASSVTLERRELDGPASRKPGKFLAPFQVILDLKFTESDAPISPGASASWQNLPHPRASPLTCFTSHTEEQEVLRQYADMDRRLAADQRKKTHESPRAQPSPPVPPPSTDEESTSAGGNLLAGQGRKGNGQPFFSQLNWQADSGYMAFRDQDEGESSSDSEGEFHEEGPAKPDPFTSPEGRREGEGKDHGAFANFEDAFAGKKESKETQKSGKTAEPKLIELSFSESDQPSQPRPRPQPQPPAQTQPHTTPVFKISGDFDPWKGLDDNEANLLGLEDSDEFNSQVSECRTAGAETFKPKTKKSSPKKTSVDSQQDPFGSTADSSGDKLFELLANAPLHPAPSTSTSSLPGIDSESRPPDAVFTPNLLDPFHPSQRSYSVPAVTLASQLQQGRTESAPGYATSGYSSQVGGVGSGSGRNSPLFGQSPYNASPRISPVPFGSSGNLAQAGSRSGSSSSLNAQFQPQPTQAAKSDPFADFGNVKQMASGKLPPPPTTTASATSAKSAFQPMTSRPNYMYGSGTGSGSAKPPSYSHKPGSQPPRSHSPNPIIGSRDERGTRPKTGVGPKLTEDMFSDILHNQGFSTPKEKGPTTLKSLKQLTDIDKAVDPERARVATWAEGKERNIRALLGSLHTILWEGEERWKEVGMHQLLQPDQVKKYYRKACLSVHPDKCQGKPHEKLARAIFDELNHAYKKFEDNPSPALF